MDEMMQLLEHDCAKYPVKERKDDDKGKKQSKKKIPEIQSFEEADILQASNMVKEEVCLSVSRSVNQGIHQLWFCAWRLSIRGRQGSDGHDCAQYILYARVLEPSDPDSHCVLDSEKQKSCTLNRTGGKGRASAKVLR